MQGINALFDAPTSGPAPLTATLSASAGLLTLNFTAPITVSGDALDQTKYSISTTGAAAVSIASLTVNSSSIVLGTTEQETDGVYSLSLPAGIVSADGSGAYAGSYSFTFIGSGVAPTFVNGTWLNSTHIRVAFSESVNTTDATDPTNYSISPALTILSIFKETDQVYILVTEEMDPATTYVVSAAGVRDLVGNAA